MSYPSRRPSLPRRRILVVYDEGLTRAFLPQTLANGHDVIETPDLGSALGLLAASGPYFDVVVPSVGASDCRRGSTVVGIAVEPGGRSGSSRPVTKEKVMASVLRETGIDIVGDMPWGHLYQRIGGRLRRRALRFDIYGKRRGLHRRR